MIENTNSNLTGIKKDEKVKPKANLMEFATESHPYTDVNIELQCGFFNRLFFGWTTKVFFSTLSLYLFINAQLVEWGNKYYFESKDLFEVTP